MENLAPPVIIVRRPKKGGHEEHGGAWKVAMADFAIAMMALFIVLWLTNTSNEQERQAIAGYFQDPKAFEDGKRVPSAYVIDLGGSPTVANNLAQSDTIDPEQILQAEEIESMSETIERKRLEKIQQDLQSKISSSTTLSPFKDQITLDITTEGLRIQITDHVKRPMFNAGSAELKYYSEDILYELAPMLATIDHKLSISGHTDSDKKSRKRPEDDKNWSLSARRADSARRALMEAGIPKSQIAQIIGMADTAPFIADNPYDESNRRIGIVLLNRMMEDAVASRGNKSEAQIEAENKNKITINRTGTLEQNLFGSDSSELKEVFSTDNASDDLFRDNSSPQQAILGETKEQRKNRERQQILDQSNEALRRLNEQRNSENNSYDNPPNKDEAFW